VSKHTISLPEWHAACAQVAVDFAVAIDHEDFNLVLSLFAENAVFEHFGGISRGHDQIQHWLKERPKQLIRHVCSNFSGKLAVSGEVEGSTYFTAYRAMGTPTLPVKSTTPIMIGEWLDRFVQTPEGWRIKHRRIQIAFAAVD
jgi:hypothetical protein